MAGVSGAVPDGTTPRETGRRRPARARTVADFRGNVPVHVVWELTLACNLKCQHCGSRAGRPRPDELSTAECLDVVDQLARLGTREITLIGGEAYLRRDWLQILRAIRGHGIYCAIQSGARNLTDRRLRAAVDAGLQGLGVSLDGLEATHDRIRGVPGSYAMAVSALERARRLGLRTSVNTVIGALNLEELPELLERILDTGAGHWQVQLTVAMGNAVDHPELLLQPYQLLELMPLLARLYHRGQDRGLLITAGNNIGYYGPFEQLWRSFDDLYGHWTGCGAGQTVIGLEADGTVKGCPSLATVGYAGGNVRDLTVEEIWNGSEELHFGRMRSAESLWGFCRTCYYAEACRGGCTWTADSLFGRPGNNPYCHHRALELEKSGLRERVAKRRDAPGAPFAIGEFDLLLEPIPGREREAALHLQAPGARGAEAGLVQIGGRRTWGVATSREGRVPTRLALCHACDRHVFDHESACPHCGADIAAARAEHERESIRRRALIQEVERLIGEAGWRREVTPGTGLEIAREAPAPRRGDPLPTPR